MNRILDDEEQARDQGSDRDENETDNDNPSKQEVNLLTITPETIVTTMTTSLNIDHYVWDYLDPTSTYFMDEVDSDEVREEGKKTKEDFIDWYDNKISLTGMTTRFHWLVWQQDFIDWYDTKQIINGTIRNQEQVKRPTEKNTNQKGTQDDWGSSYMCASCSS